MTYCVAVSLPAGLVLASDSRTHAGPDQVNIFGKMHVMLATPERFFVLLSAGNLATSQAVRTQLLHDLEFEHRPNLESVATLSEAAGYLGRVNAAQRLRLNETRDHEEAQESMDATFILGGRLAGRGTGIFVVHPRGDYLHASEQTPYLQIGELKYGKPILDRLISLELSLEDAARVVLLSMDATMRSNLTVGPPIELLIYDAKTPEASRHMVFDAEDAYLRELRHGWQAQLAAALGTLPPLPSHGRRPEVTPSG